MSPYGLIPIENTTMYFWFIDNQAKTLPDASLKIAYMSLGLYRKNAQNSLEHLKNTMKHIKYIYPPKSTLSFVPLLVYPCFPLFKHSVNFMRRFFLVLVNSMCLWFVVKKHDSPLCTLIWILTSDCVTCT